MDTALVIEAGGVVGIHISRQLADAVHDSQAVFLAAGVGPARWR